MVGQELPPLPDSDCLTRLERVKQKLSKVFYLAARLSRSRFREQIRMRGAMSNGKLYAFPDRKLSVPRLNSHARRRRCIDQRRLGHQRAMAGGEAAQGQDAKSDAVVFKAVRHPFFRDPNEGINKWPQVLARGRAAGTAPGWWSSRYRDWVLMVLVWLFRIAAEQQPTMCAS